jgi:hypothetical protein
MKRSMMESTENSSFVADSVDVEKSLRNTAALLVQLNQLNPNHGQHPKNILPLDDHDELSEAAFAHGPSSPYSFPIRLRLLQPQKQIEVPAAIFLYNLGLAYMLLACSHNGKINEKYGARILNCALKSLSMSHCILMQQVNSCNGTYPELRLKQLCALVLQCLFRVFHLTGQTHQADRVLATLTRLVHEGRESEGILQSLNVETGKHTMAPAA